MSLEDKQKKIIAMLYKEYMIVDPGGSNADRIKKKLSAMSVTEFGKFVNGLTNKKEMLDLECPNMKVNIKVSDLLAGTRSINATLFSKIKFIDPLSKTPYLTNEKFMVLKLPVRRMVQSLRLKMHLSENDKHTDQATGQVIVADKAAKLSAPEAQALNAKELRTVLQEVLNVRGGNVDAWSQMRMALEETGQCNLSDIVTVAKTRSTVTTQNLFTSLHLDANVIRR